MRSAHITRFQAEAAFDGTEYDVSALQADIATAYDLAEPHSFDYAVDDVELELTADEYAATLEFLYDDRQPVVLKFGQLAADQFDEFESEAA